MSQNSKELVNKNHWIIVNAKRGTIWKKPFLSYEEARRELNYQLSIMKENEGSVDWKIEIMNHKGYQDSYDSELNNF